MGRLTVTTSPKSLTKPVKWGGHRLHSESEHKGEESTLNQEPAKACLKRYFWGGPGRTVLELIAD